MAEEEEDGDEIIEGSQHESDMQLSEEGSDVDMANDTLDTKPEEEEQEDDKEVEPEEEEEEADEDAIESEELSPPPSPLPSKPRLKIKLKLPQVLSPNEPSSRAASTPSGEPSQPPSRRGISRDIDIESEDEDDEAEAAGSLTRPMTSRQAVLASVVDSSHVSLSESSRKKKQLTEHEIALRREETARKRKNLSEKKLEDEKAETINRLLKKQSKSKNKRNVLSTADDRTPVSVTPAVIQSARDGSEILEGEAYEPIEITPTTYRWVSTTKPLSPTVVGEADGAHPKSEGKMRLMFSVPVSVLPSEVVEPPITNLNPPMSTRPVCDVSGCQQPRKYRFVKDWMKGACGMDHLKVLEHQMKMA
ncbi:hypothetical protein HYDPIDRAFT_112856 [Hydnomerulius pinastri MD-312]|uniref:INO80 complex subunit B-like conserved region domain-containing protein n=1 Tax=Hydnomerulius pinastri MD-312 TaxID=994086 RepID=A0A0C9VE92_9AGAM|nr:hypothetical protein HYDPIDRAFT_112856 [Hydnomerulius pinastri MD-312]